MIITTLTAPQQPPIRTERPAPAEESRGDFYESFSAALETTTHYYSGAVGLTVGAACGFFVGTGLGMLTGSNTGLALGVAAGLIGGGFGGAIGGARVGDFLMAKAAEVGEAHTPQNPVQGRAVAQAVTAGAITFFTGSPLMTALVVGGSAAYAAQQS